MSKYIRATVPVQGYDNPIIYATPPLPEGMDVELASRQLAVHVASALRKSNYTPVLGQEILFEVINEGDDDGFTPFKEATDEKA